MKKTKQHQHCAHVAARYAESARVMATAPGRTIFGYPAVFLPSLNETLPALPGDPQAAIRHAQIYLAYVRRAISEFKRAGGVPGQIPPSRGAI